MSKGVVIVYARNKVDGEWMWGGHRLLRMCSYTYLRIEFSYNEAWDMHVKRVIHSGRKRLNQLHSILSNREDQS